MHLYSINGLSAVTINNSDPKGLINFTEDERGQDSKQLMEDRSLKTDFKIQVA